VERVGSLATDVVADFFKGEVVRDGDESIFIVALNGVVTMDCFEGEAVSLEVEFFADEKTVAEAEAVFDGELLERMEGEAVGVVKFVSREDALDEISEAESEDVSACDRAVFLL
jgi:hypothetical protein